MRDFVEDSLYNPNYGYFPQQATIFTPAGDPIDFRAMRDSAEFQNEVSRRYTAYGTDEEGPCRQIWHAPTRYVVRPTSCLFILLILAHNLTMGRPSLNAWC
jgi:hypothetical protein